VSAARPTSWTTRRTLAWGLVAALAWVGLAAVSGGLSPLARRPLLDGLIPGAAYRWVAPPPELAADNQPPSAGEFELEVREGRTLSNVFFTADNQVTLLASEGVGEGRRHDGLRLTVTPEDPATFPDPPGELVPFGNAVRLEAAWAPSGQAVEGFATPLTTILVYPATPNLHATEHDLLWSPDGSAWETLETIDSIAQQQVQADVPGPGVVLVAGVPAPLPSPPSGDDAGGRQALSTVLVVFAGVSLLLGIGILVRARSAG
jgi:hypothetical protein